MHARLTLMNLGPGMRDFATSIADESFKLSKTLPGFVSATYVIYDEEAGDYGSLSIWKTAADADAAGEKVGPWLQQKASGKIKIPPTIRVGEVYEPK